MPVGGKWNFLTEKGLDAFFDMKNLEEFFIDQNFPFLFS